MKESMVKIEDYVWSISLLSSWLIGEIQDERDCYLWVPAPNHQATISF